MNRPVRQTERRRGIDVVGPDGARVRRRRARGSHPDFRVEVLEDRSLLAATLTISSVGGALTYTASGGGSRPTISIDSSNTADVIITDLDQIITLSGAGTAGWTGSGTSTVIGPTNSYSSMAISGSTAQSQSLTIDYSASSTLDPLHVSGLAFNPAVAGSGFSNALTLMSGTGGIRFTGESYAPSGAGAGTITYSDSANSNVPITFTNLAPVTDTVPSPSFLFTAPGGATTVNVVDGPASTTEINDGGTGQFELIDFANKAAATVNVNNAGATTTVDTTTASAGLTSLHVFSQAATRTIDVEATPSGVTTTTDTGSPSGGNTDVGLNGLLTSIKGPLIVQSTGGTNTLTVNDSAETVPTSYTIAGSTLVATSFPTTIALGTGITTLNLDSSGASTVDLSGLTQGAVTAFSFTGGTALGANTLNVTSAVATLNDGTAGTLTFGAGQPTVNYTNFATVNITKLATAPVGTATTIKGTEAQALNNVVVATFTESDLANKSANFVASIDWGDMTTSTGTIVPNGTGGFNVAGSHTYSASGTYTVDVTLTDQSTSGTTTVGGTTINVTSNGPVASTPSPIVSTADIAAAPLTAIGATVRGIEGNVLVNPVTGTAPVLVATFMDTGTPGAASAYTATIDWGDGTTGAATSITSQGTANGTVYSVFGSHTYAETGTYALNVTITNTASGSVAIASGQAVIADAALTASATQPTVSTTEDVTFSGAIGSFADGNPAAPTTDYTYVTINWGDGTPATAGTISQPGGVGTVFLVSGTHTYADAGVNGGIGHYPITINVHDVDGSTVAITNTANVADVPLIVTGYLNPASDSGVTHTHDITDVVQPNFLGTTNQPGATIKLYATASGSTTPVLIGQGVSNASDAWSITANQDLADGAYLITAIATDSSGHTVSSTTTIVANLVIDNVGPKVTSVAFNRLQGQIVVTFQDYGGLNNAGTGLNLSSVIDANNYQLVTVHHPRVGRFRVDNITVSPGTTTGTQTATLTINGGHYIKGGWYFFTIYSLSPSDTSGIRDIAGNALDGEFYGYFPSGNNVNGGNFVAQLTAFHHTIFAPSTVVGRATPVSPPGTRQGTVHDPRTFNPSKLPHFNAFPDPPKADRRDPARLVHHAAKLVRHTAGLVHHSAPALSHPIRRAGGPMIATPATATQGQATAVGALGVLDQALNQVDTSSDKHRKS